MKLLYVVWASPEVWAPTLSDSGFNPGLYCILGCAGASLLFAFATDRAASKLIKAREALHNAPPEAATTASAAEAAKEPQPPTPKPDEDTVRSRRSSVQG